METVKNILLYAINSNKIIIPIIGIIILFFLGIIKKRSIGKFIISLDVSKITALLPPSFRPSFIIVELPTFIILLILVIFYYNTFSSNFEIFAILLFAIIMNLILMPMFGKYTR